MSAFVEFIYPPDFYDELRKDGALIERRILRVMSIKVAGAEVERRIVEASVLIQTAGVARVVRLRYRAGSLTGVPSIDEETRARAGRVEAELKALAGELHLEVRAGSYKEAGEP